MHWLGHHIFIKNCQEKIINMSQQLFMVGHFYL
jgi:hypothetical protein